MGVKDRNRRPQALFNSQKNLQNFSDSCHIESLDTYIKYLLTPFLGTCPGWQDKTAVCGLQDELPMRMVADKGEVERD